MRTKLEMIANASETEKSFAISLCGLLASIIESSRFHFWLLSCTCFFCFVPFVEKLFVYNIYKYTIM